MKRGSIALARSLCMEIEGDDEHDLDGRKYGSVDIAEILSAEVEKLRADLERKDALLREALRMLNIVFDYDGDVFRKYHNDAVDTLNDIKKELSK